MNKLDRYLNHIDSEAKDMVIRCLMTEVNKEGKKIIEQQVEEFNKMYPGGGV